jgi:hypothetical protein
MKAWIVIGLAFAALICGLRAAHLWYQSTLVRPEPEGFEPVVSELKQGWWQLAEWKAAEKVAGFNGLAAVWTAAAAVFGFASVTVGMWPTSN